MNKIPKRVGTTCITLTVAAGLTGFAALAQSQSNQQPQEPQSQSETTVQNGNYNQPGYSQATIRQVQQKLQNEGYYKGSIDGIYGPDTQAAVKQYQQSQNLNATGTLDSQTLNKLGVEPQSNGNAASRNEATTVGQQTANRPSDENASSGTLSESTVRRTQEKLKADGFYHGKVDGIMGPETRAALRRYQKKNDLRADGRLTQKTAESLGVATPGAYFETAGSQISNNYSSAGSAVANGSTGMANRMAQGEVGNGFVRFGKGIGRGAKDVGVGTAHAAESAYNGLKHVFVPGSNK